MQKINKDYLENIEIENIFGDWILNTENLKSLFKSAKPFEHIIIPNFLQEDYANLLSDTFPKVNETWHTYYNPFEVKYTYDNINNLEPHFKNLFYILSTPQIINIFSNISEIENLTYDPYLHGAGLHSYPRNGRLGMHLDYEKHPHLDKERRLNIILYLSKDWKDEWNGDTQLWNKDMTECVKSSPVRFNTAIVFKTNDISWHGVPEKIKCPENLFRNSFAYYYISPLETKSNKDKIGNNGSGYRTKATFTKRPQDPLDHRIEKLFSIRPLRLITKKDMEEIYPEWNVNEN